ncbi:MAG: MaoC/PaaZ C-terminal domain-containing protein, partial [Caldilinea sp.]
MFGQRVAHGLLVLSIASGLAVRLGFMEDTILAFRSLEWKFTAPVFIGDTIRLRVTVEATKPMPRLGGGLVTLKMEVMNQKDEVVNRGSWDVLCRSQA